MEEYRNYRTTRSKSLPNITNVPHFDRFIPCRANFDVNTSHVSMVTSDGHGAEKLPEQYKDDKAMCYNRLLSEALDKHDQRVLNIVQHNDSGYCGTPTSPAQSQFFNQSMDTSFESPIRHDKRRVTTTPECIMDMPRLRDDFYTNILDWGKTNKIAVALQQTTYIWDADTKACRKIDFCMDDPENHYVSALVWDPHGTQLAIADNQGTICICDPEKVEVVRQFTMKEKLPVLAVRWTEQAIFSGTRKGTIYIHDKRCPKQIAQLDGHQNEICGLQVEKGTGYLASGGDQGTVCIWNLNTMSCYRTIQAHSACSKALSWCPWRNSVIATGGGSTDGHIRIWHIHTGEKLGELYTESQICSLLWSEEYRELASSHGSSKIDNNDIILWKMRMMNFEPIARLRQHLGRPLHMSLSPDGTTLASAGADEALCLWKCFPSQKKIVKESMDYSPLVLGGMIR